jgi:N-acetylglucosaminyl-diphospho-decaprenol L-rhamnosyltransferase
MIAAEPVPAPMQSASRPALRSLPQPVEVSILIVTWNSERWIERCLRAIPAACEGLAFEIIVYDNASDDSTLARLSVGIDGIEVIRSTSNDGFAAGMNRALTQSAGRFVFLLNPDCELAPRALTLLASFLERNPNAAAAAPLLDDDGGDSQREFQLRRLPTLGTFASEILLLDKLFPSNATTARYRYRDLDLTHPIRIEQPAAAALLLRREVFDEVGPLDEQFAPAWFEDVDYCHRLAAAGKEIYVVPAATARHYGGASLEHVGFGRFIDLWYGNMWLYARKWFRKGDAEALRWVVIVGMLLRCVAAFVGFAHPEVGRWPALRAYSTVLKKAFKRWDDGSPSSS